MDPPPNYSSDEHNSSDELERISEVKTSASTTASTSASPAALSSIEPCRLSWFLVKNDAASAAEHGDYCIIHAMDIINQDPKDVFLFNAVHFNLGKDTLSGQVLAAADHIQLVEADMQEWLKADRLKPAAATPYLLVQYRPAPDRLVHRVMHENDVTPVVLGQAKQNSCREVYVKDGVRMCQGYVLTRSNDANRLDNELIKVKVKCYEAIRSTFPQPDDIEKDARIAPEDNTWLLLQYSRSISDCIYTIMRYKDTQKLDSNLYPGIQTYLTVGNTIYQTMIVHKSLNELEMLAVLNNIASSCLLSAYPAIDDTEFRNAELVKYERQDLNEYKSYIAANVRKSDITKCQQVSKCIEKEAAYISHLLDNIDRTEEQMESVLHQIREMNDNVKCTLGDK
ncbi:uncharacterized protein LOC118742034 [Rhagoletis pomonella]|uniref:uncharacterized protein LOC118742034 n=1 Tax=Rhagoletis pomonella TaxID=28610 RepID=UPI0017870845|nr:uncharacterized protein LOC118742034 [Rhagoletis pomonella]